MFVLYLIFPIIGIFLGGLTFFMGVTLITNEIKKAEAERGEQVEEVEEEVRELTNEDLEAEAKEVKRKALSPLPYLLGAEGLLAFVGSTLMIVFRLFTELTFAWWIFPVAFVGYALFAFVVDGFAMSGYAAKTKEDENE
ncbi:MAG: hypothetical protein IJS93_02050 [Clostridia bacterium]|nr:hypothetical protein [Clostridia bacterium]